MGTEIKSREELVDEIANALQENFEYIDTFNYIDLDKNEIGMAIDDITVCDELFGAGGFFRGCPLHSPN